MDSRFFVLKRKAVGAEQRLNLKKIHLQSLDDSLHNERHKISVLCKMKVS